jgi:citrate synthase
MTLLETVLQAHHESALRGNCSHQAVALAAFGSGDYFKAIAAGLLTLGGTHAPLVQTYDFLERFTDEEDVTQRLAQQQRIPGWGNGFVKDGPDQLWAMVDEQLRVEAPAWMTRIDQITGILHAHRKWIYPNPSCYTAAAALHLHIPKYAVGELLIRGRLTAWTEEFGRIQQEAPCLIS